MDKREIKIALIRAGKTQADIARACKCSRQLVNAVIACERTNREVRKVIANAIKKPLLKVFPDEKFREPYGRIVKRVGFQS